MNLPFRPSLDRERIVEQLRDTMWQVQLTHTTGSTNRDVLAAIDDSEPHGLVRVAEYQDAGRGRLGRTWVQPPYAGLNVSLLLRPHVPYEQLGRLSLVVGVAAVEAITSLTALSVTLKWPNDVLVGTKHRKIAGILAEARHGAAAVGIGVNVTTTRTELPSDRSDVTSFLEEGEEIDRSSLLIALLRACQKQCDAWESAGGDLQRSGVLSQYRAISHTLGRTVSVHTPGADPLTGVARDIDTSGRLLVDTSGDIVPVSAGEVSLRATT